MHLFTDTYIAMCATNKEIEARSPSLFDLKAGHAVGEAFLTNNGIFIIGSDTKFEDIPVLLSWLPLLHQLLGMLGGPDDFMAFLNLRDSWALCWALSPGRQFHLITDWHELALAVVMQEKYGKRWDGKEWVMS